MFTYLNTPAPSAPSHMAFLPPLQYNVIPSVDLVAPVMLHGATYPHSHIHANHKTASYITTTTTTTANIRVKSQ